MFSTTRRALLGGSLATLFCSLLPQTLRAKPPAEDPQELRQRRVQAAIAKLMGICNVFEHPSQLGGLMWQHTLDLTRRHSIELPDLEWIWQGLMAEQAGPATLDAMEDITHLTEAVWYGCLPDGWDVDDAPMLLAGAEQEHETIYTPRYCFQPAEHAKWLPAADDRNAWLASYIFGQVFDLYRELEVSAAAATSFAAQMGYTEDESRQLVRVSDFYTTVMEENGLITAHSQMRAIGFNIAVSNTWAVSHPIGTRPLLLTQMPSTAHSSWVKMMAIPKTRL